MSQMSTRGLIISVLQVEDLLAAVKRNMDARYGQGEKLSKATGDLIGGLIALRRSLDQLLIGRGVR